MIIAYQSMFNRFSEEYIVIIAANIPCLRSFFQKLFRMLGGQISSHGSRGNTLEEGSRRVQGHKVPYSETRDEEFGEFEMKSGMSDSRVLSYQSEPRNEPATLNNVRNGGVNYKRA